MDEIHVLINILHCKYLYVQKLYFYSAKNYKTEKKQTEILFRGRLSGNMSKISGCEYERSFKIAALS